MRKTDHVLIVSEGAEYLAEELDVEDKADKTSLIEAFTNALKNMKDLPKTDGPESEKEDVEKVKDGVPSDRAKIDAQESKKEGNIENKGNIEKKKIDELSDGAKTDVQESKMEDKIKNKEDFDEEKDDVPNEVFKFCIPPSREFHFLVQLLERMLVSYVSESNIFTGVFSGPG